MLGPGLLAADFQPSDLIGEWSGQPKDGPKNTYTFLKGRLVEWTVDDPTFTAMFPSGVWGHYTVRNTTPIWQLDIQDFNVEALKNITFQGILQPLSATTFKMDGQTSDDGPRPESFGPQTVIYTKVGPSTATPPPGMAPTASGDVPHTSSPAINPPLSPSVSVLHRSTIATYPYGDHTSVVAIHTDGGVSFKEPFSAAQKIPYFNNAINLVANSRVAETADGAWWFVGETTTKIPIKPDYHVVGLAQSRAQAFGLLSWDGTAYITVANFEFDRKPDTVLTNITRILGNDQSSQTSPRFTLLRSDGTVWITPHELPSFGWVTTNGELTATEVPGLDHVKDVSVYSLREFDTGVALEENGSVAYWGVGDPVTLPVAPGSATHYIPVVPVPQVRHLSGHPNIIKVAAGPEAVGFIDADGKVWMFGGGWFFPLPAPGKGGQSGSPEPVQIAGIENAVDLQIANGLAIALCRDGTVWSWNDKQAPTKIFDNVSLPEDGPVPGAASTASIAKPIQNPILGKWTFSEPDIGTLRSKDCEFTTNEMIWGDGTHVPVKYRIEQNTVTVTQPDPNPPFVCTLKYPNYADVILGSPHQLYAPTFGMYRKTGEPAPAKPPPPPSLLTLANLCNNIYSGNAGYGDYKFIGNNCTIPPNTCMNVGLAAGAYVNQDGSQVVIAIRGTVLHTATSGSSLADTDQSWEMLANIAADASFGGTAPTSALATDVCDASAFVQQIQSRYPSANITLTGHSLGAAVAQLIGQASGMSAYGFNAPGASQLYRNLQRQLNGFTHVTNPNYMNINYRIYGDQVSLFGQPMGTTITLQSPAYTTFAIDSADSTDNIIVKLRVLSDAFVHMHVMNTVLAQIADKAPQVPPTGEPDFTQALQNAAKLIKK